MPELLTCADSTSSAALAVMITWPPSAMIARLLETSAFSAPWLMVTSTSELPPKFNVICWPEAIATVPRLGPDHAVIGHRLAEQ
jgi:hypothetical protein